MILGSGVIDIEIEQFQKLARPRHIHVYPCLYGWPSRYSPIPRKLAAATALNYWNQGADGIYLFNWFPHTQNNSEQTGPWMASMLDRIGDPARLRAAESELLFVVDRGRPAGEYPSNWLHCVLPTTLKTGKPLSLRLRVRENLATKASSLRLGIQVDNLQPGDRIAVTLGGTTITEWKPVGKDRLETKIPASLIARGDNPVKLELVQQSKASGTNRVARAVELNVRR